jgi:hypothetical protein
MSKAKVKFSGKPTTKGAGKKKSGKKSSSGGKKKSRASGSEDFNDRF